MKQRNSKRFADIFLIGLRHWILGMTSLVLLNSFSWAEETKETPPELNLKFPYSRIDDPFYKLSLQERQLLGDGLMSTQDYVTGGVVGSLVGFGIGHAFQGRYQRRGWIFTAGESLGLSLLAWRAAECDRQVEENKANGSKDKGCDDVGAFVGFGTFLGFRIWEAIDLWAQGLSHRRRVKEIQDRLIRMQKRRWEARVVPQPGGAQMAFKWNFE